MDNSGLIRQIRSHVAFGQKDAHTEPLLELARKAVKEQTAPPEQQVQLIAFIKELETLLGQFARHAPGSSATLF